MIPAGPPGEHGPARKSRAGPGRGGRHPSPARALPGGGDAGERGRPDGDYPCNTAGGQAGWLRIVGRGAAKPEDRSAALRRLGAQASRLSTAERAEDNMQTLEQIDG